MSMKYSIEARSEITQSDEYTPVHMLYSGFQDSTKMKGEVVFYHWKPSETILSTPPWVSFW